jgi:tetratricopeptide (TPR) repeat protein
MNRGVNLRAVLMLAAGIPALFVSVHFLHAFQMKRGASDLLEQADLAAAAGHSDEVRELLRDYLGLKPDDAEVQARYGRAVKEAARSRDELRKAYQALARAIQLDPGLTDVRREAATLAADAGLYTEARDHAEALREAFPEDGEAECLLGRCAEAAGQYDEAVRWFEAAEKHAPERETAYLHHAILLRDRRRLPEAADEVARRLATANPESIAARLAAARYFVRYGLWTDAERETAFVTGSPGADGADVYLMAAGVDDVRGRPGPARERINEGLRKHPGECSLTIAGARLDIRAGRRDDARKALHTVAELPDVATLQLASAGELLLELDDVDAARGVAERLAEKKGPVASRIQARLHIRNGEWGEARVILERLRTEALPPADAVQVEVFLGMCYEHLDDPEAALAAYRRAQRIDPSRSPARRGEISALMSLGKMDEAEQAYRRIVTSEPDMYLGLARLLLSRQLRRPEGERQWSGVQNALANLPKPIDTSAEAEQLRADLLSVSGKADEGRRLLEAERDRKPDQVRPWMALARFALQRGDAQGAEQILREAEKKRGPDATLTLARIELAVREEPAAARKAVAGFEPAMESFAGTDQLRVLRGLAEAYYRLGDTNRCIALWRRVAEQAPRDLDVRLRLLELAYRASDVEAMEKQLAGIRNLEGPGGGLAAWGEAARGVVLAEKGDRTQLAEAKRRLAEARARRPRWAPIPLLDARIALLEGDRDRAAEQLVLAVRFGERDPAVIRTAVDGLYRRRRYSEARDLLQDCAEQTMATPDLGRRAAELTLIQAGAEGSGRGQALKQARQAVPANSKDPHDYLWLAQVARAAGEPAEAEKLLRTALTLSDKEPGTWLALIQLLASTDVKKAEAAVAEARGKLSADDAPFVLGPGYDMLGQADKAREQYETLLAHRPSDPAALQVVADFYARRGPAAKAQATLRRLLDPAVAVNEAARGAARRELALIVAGPGSYAKFREALSLLTEGDRQATREDEVTRAILLASRPEKRHEARALLEKLAKDGLLPSDAQFVLVRLMEADGDVARADDLVLSLLGTESKNPTVVSWHVQSLLRRGQAQTANPWIDALRTLEPDSLRTATLTARVAAKEGRTIEAVHLLLDFAQKHPDRRLNIALALESIEATTEAEKLLREEANGNRPEATLALAEYLSRHQKVSEAIGLCERAWKTCPPEIVAASSLSVVRAGSAGATELAALADQIAAAAKKHPDSIPLAQGRAELEELRGRFDEALPLYEDLLRRQPDYVAALNNRAWLLALKATPGEEAIRLIDHVIDLTGPIANYLDTRAVAYLAAGQPARAVADMEEAIRQEPAAAFYFHLGQAQLRAGDRPAAVAALREGRKHGLQPEVVHPLERERCRQMLAELEIN